jgi:high-affinity nickel-transport protein
MEGSEYALLVMALTLGIKHGFDLDHLSIIDAITRTVRCQRTARMSGILFSFGHGIIVMIVSLLAGSGLLLAQVPAWLEQTGSLISLFFLFLFGLLTLFSVFTTTAPAARGKSALFKKIIGPDTSPVTIMLIGALFAFSFDTFSQVALFSLSAALISGWAFSGMLGFTFMTGMMLADGLNSIVLATVLVRTDKTTFFISRLSGLLISVFSLTIGSLNLIKLVQTYA